MNIFPISQNQYHLIFPGMHQVQVFEVQGKLLLSSAMNEQMNLELSGFSKGLYVVVIDGNHVKKLMRQ